MKKLLGYIKITRPLNLLIILLAVFMGCLIVSNTCLNDILFFVPIILIAAAGYILNDIFDLKEDSINRPKRTLVSKVITKKEAYILLLNFFIFAVIISLFKIQLIIPVLFLTFGVIIYDKYLKSTPIIGNILTSILSSFPVIWAGIINGKIFKLFWIFLLAFFLHLAREIVKDISDMKGDTKAQKKTTAIILGKKISIYLSLVFYLISAIGIFYIKFYYKFSNYYLIMMILTVFTSLVVSLIFLMKKDFKRASDALRLVMFFQVIIVIIEKIVF